MLGYALYIWITVTECYLIYLWHVISVLIFAYCGTAIKISRGNYLLWPVEMTGLTKKICVTGKSAVEIRMNWLILAYPFYLKKSIKWTQSKKIRVGVGLLVWFLFYFNVLMFPFNSDTERKTLGGRSGHITREIEMSRYNSWWNVCW